MLIMFTIDRGRITALDVDRNPDKLTAIRVEGLHSGLGRHDPRSAGPGPSLTKVGVDQAAPQASLQQCRPYSMDLALQIKGCREGLVPRAADRPGRSGRPAGGRSAPSR